MAMIMGKTIRPV